MNGVFNTAAVGISGDNVVENVQGTEPAISAIYNTGSGIFTVVNAPGAQETVANGIDGSNVVGYYQGNTGQYGFIDNGGTFTTLSTIFPTAISGNDILAGNVLHNMSTSTATTLSVPGATSTTAKGVDGNNVVGYYYSGGDYYGFLATPGPPKIGYALIQGQVQLAIPGPFNSAIVQESIDMVNWVSVYTNTPPCTFTDSAAATLPCRFYRTVLSQ